VAEVVEAVWVLLVQLVLQEQLALLVPRASKVWLAAQDYKET
jgi:hypothetical protein